MALAIAFKGGSVRRRTWARAALTVSAALFLGLGLAGAQESLAARELRNGDRMARDGKREQAIEAWSAILSRYPDAPEAATALERLGTTAYPVGDFAGLGSRPDADFQQALRYFTRLVEGYRQSPEAPAALLRLGLLRSDPSASFFDRDEAYGHFSALVTLYPESALRPAGLYGLGVTLIQQRLYGRALGPLARLDAEFPRVDAADDGLWLQGEALVRLGQFRAALRTYQDLRDRFPGSRYAPLARDRNTHLARLAGLERRDLYARPVLVRPGLGQDWRLRTLSDLGVDSAHRIALADERGDAVYVLDLRGQPLGRHDVIRPAAVWMGSGSPLAQSEGGLWQDGVRTELVMTDGRSFQGQAGMLSRDSRDRIILWDRRSGRLLRFDRRGRLERVLVESSAFRIDDAAACEDGSVALLDARQDSVRFLAGESQERTVYLPRDGLRRPEKISCDFIGNLYLLDRSNRELAVVSPEGGLRARLSSGRDDEDPFPRPVDLAVSSRGSILVYDERRQGVVVFP